jgi:2-keto-4-pentenoate hydratase/2-oxohepta-3-ene-1,7-dioic acid hydratase in catechol pathway
VICVSVEKNDLHGYIGVLMIDPRPTIFFADSSRVLHPTKIVCVGRNYAEHAREMNAPLPEKPVLFLKPPSAIIQNGGMVRRPAFSKDLQHEIELVVAIGRTGKDIPESKAMDFVAGYGVGLDMTLRDVQSEAKKKGMPWAVAKGFDTSAPISSFVGREGVPDPHALQMNLWVNGQLRQSANTRTMLFSIAQVIGYISTVFTLEAGDLVFTGTPEGVATVVPGDLLKAAIDGVGVLDVGVVGDIQTGGKSA